MVTGATFRKTFLIVTGSAGIFVLIFMIISTQYLTLTTNTLYRDIRAQLSTFGNYTIIESLTSSVVATSKNETFSKKPTNSNVPKGENKSADIPVPSLTSVKTKRPKVYSPIILVRNNRTIERNVLVKEYESCFNFSIDKPDICHPEQRIPLLLIVISGIAHRSARNAIRATWGGYANELGIPVFFLLGSTLNDIEQRNVEREDELFEDIVQENCMDTYRNMTLKTVSMMKWVATYCSHVPFVLKTDDDMVVNVDRLLLFLRSLNSTSLQPSIYGRLARRWRPHRFKHSKWYVSPRDYRGIVFPDFTTGPAYLFTSNAAFILYKESLNTNYLFLEDVFMTGIVAEKVGVRRIHNKQFHNSTSTLIYRAFGTLITSHGHSSRDIRHIWYRHNIFSDDANRNIFKGSH